MSSIRIFLAAFFTSLISVSSVWALTLTDSSPITVSQNGQVIENVRIHAVNQPAIKIQNFSNVIIRNVEINHEGGRGIQCTGADGLLIENVAITHTGSKSPLPSEGEINIDCEFSSGIVIKNARLRGGSSGIYLLQSPNAHLSFIEGYNFRGPIPRGQLVQFNSSASCTLEDFSAINNPDPTASWPEDIISVYNSDNCIIRRGLLEGNNSETGVGIMFELSDNGLVEDVDTVGQANGSFFAYPGNDVTFRRTRARDNICVSQGRGAPSSNALVWGGDPSRSTGLRIEDSRYYNLCNPGNIVWEWNTFDIVSYASEDFLPRDPIVNQFLWETVDSDPIGDDPDPIGDDPDPIGDDPDPIGDDPDPIGDDPDPIGDDPDPIGDDPDPIGDDSDPIGDDPKPVVDSTDSLNESSTSTVVSFSAKSSGGGSSKGGRTKSTSSSGARMKFNPPTKTCNRKTLEFCATSEECLSLGPNFYFDGTKCVSLKF